MPDPHVLYVVTAVVVLGLVGWVIVVLSRPESDAGLRRGGAPAAGGKAASSAPKSGVDGAAASSSQAPLEDDDKPKLDSHAEIRDDPSVHIMGEVPIDVEE